LGNIDSNHAYGANVEKAYAEILKNKTPKKKVIVAVIDSGIDTTHEDLKSVIWTNKKEIPGNGLDDDKNGYIDDVHGWNFLGGKDGKNVGKDSYEGARIYYKLKKVYGTNNFDEKSLSASQLEEFKLYKRVEAQLESQAKEGFYVCNDLKGHCCQNTNCRQFTESKSLQSNVYG